jgi:hypothetical protein
MQARYSIKATVYKGDNRSPGLDAPEMGRHASTEDSDARLAFESAFLVQPE